MNGEEFRAALRREMDATTPPPPLSTTATLGAARRARVRRRTAWACAGSAAVVLAVAGVAAIGTPGAGSSFSPGGPRPQTNPYPSVTVWPTGPDGRPQGDRTARAGSRYDQGIRLLDKVVSVVPAGYTAPENPANQPDQNRSHQAQFEDRVNGVDVWSYSAGVTLAQGERTGRLLVEVHTAGNKLSAEPCQLAQQFWAMQGECQLVTVGATQVGVVIRPVSDKRFDQWAAYRHPDGVVVFVAQGADLRQGQLPKLTLPFSAQQLAAIAVDERFHLQ